MDEIQIKVKNVKCGGCVANITSHLSERADIETIEVEIGTGIVSIHGKQLDIDAIRDQLTTLGYPPSSHG